MADAADSKSAEGNFMWVRLPPPAPREKTALLPRLYSSRYGGGACFFSIHKNAFAFIVRLQ